MRKHAIILILAAAVLGSVPAVQSDVGRESDFQKFQRTLMSSFIGHLAADGKDVTNRQRAMFMGYILHRQAKEIGEFETDKARMASLLEDVKAFLRAASPGEDLWPVVEAGMRGEFTREIDAMLGGSAYVEPTFNSLDDMVASARHLEFPSEGFDRHPQKNEILQMAMDFLQLVKEERYTEARKLTGGRLLEEITAFLADLAQSDETRQESGRFSNLEWKIGSASLSDTDPPMVKIDFLLRIADEGWYKKPCILIRDHGRWKIAYFDL